MHAADVFQDRLGASRPARILSLARRFRRHSALASKRYLAGPHGASARTSTSIRWKPSATACGSSPSGRPLPWGSVVAYAIGSIGAFLVFHWPGLLRQIVLGYLIVFLAVRIAAVLGRFLLAPYNDRFRVIPMDAAAARYWYVRLKLIVGWMMLGLVTKGVLGELEISLPARDIVGYALWARHAGDPAGSHLAPAGRKRRGRTRARA